jgi:hypothetical protein
VAFLAPASGSLGLQASCLTSSALVGASKARAIDDLEELRDLDAPELVNLARVDGVRGCRVAELVRVDLDAKQNKRRRNKDSLPLGCYDISKKQTKIPPGG